MGINRMEKDRSSSAAAADSDEFYDEETKMDRFYELIRSFNQARANHQRNLQQSSNQNHVVRHSNGNDNLGNDAMNKAALKLSDNNHASLIPSFKWEDFNFNSHEEQDHQVVVSEKSGNDFLHNNTSNFREIETDIITDKYSTKKKRKIYELDDGGDDDYSDGYGEKDDDDRLKVSRPQLDLNLAL